MYQILTFEGIKEFLFLCCISDEIQNYIVVAVFLYGFDIAMENLLVPIFLLGFVILQFYAFCRLNRTHQRIRTINEEREGYLTQKHFVCVGTNLVTIEIRCHVIPSRRSIGMFGLCLTIILRRTIAEIPVYAGNRVSSDIRVKLNAITKTELILATITIGKGYSVHFYTLLYSG